MFLFTQADLPGDPHKKAHHLDGLDHSKKGANCTSQLHPVTQFTLGAVLAAVE
jgi:hypothetical protein